MRAKCIPALSSTVALLYAFFGIGNVAIFNNLIISSWTAQIVSVYMRLLVCLHPHLCQQAYASPCAEARDMPKTFENTILAAVFPLRLAHGDMP